MSDDVKPKPCPSCENGGAVFLEDSDRTDIHYECGCGWRGPTKGTAERALAAWNRRPEPLSDAVVDRLIEYWSPVPIGNQMTRERWKAFGPSKTVGGVLRFEVLGFFFDQALAREAVRQALKGGEKI